MTRTLRSGRSTSVARGLRSRRLVLVAAATVTLSFVAGACGSEGSPAGGAGASTTVGETSSTTLAPQVIVVSGSPNGGGSAVPAAAGAADEAMDSKMIAALIHYTYEGAVPDLTGPAPSWSFPTGAVVDEADVAAVAAALGVAGEPVAVPEDEGGGWRVGPADYSGPVVTFGTDALQSWWYNAPIAPREDCAYYPPGDPMGDPETADLPSCDEVPPPEGVPDEATAEALAEELFAAVGMDPARYELETYADEWSAGVTAYLVVDGMKTWATASVGFGGDAELTWASGFLAEPVRAADYERIGVEAVVERLNEQSASWWGGDGVLMDGMSDAGAARTDDGVAAEVAADEMPAAPIDSTGTDVVGPTGTDVAVPDTEVVPPDASTPVVIDPAPVDSGPVITEPEVTEPEMTEPETIEITLSDATPSLEMIYAADGTIWLVPGYRFATSDGYEITAPAVADEYLQYDDAVPMPVDAPMPVEEPIPVDISLPGEISIPIVPTEGNGAAPSAGSGDGSSGSAAPLCAGLPTAITEPPLGMAVADIIVGMCVDDARAFIEGYQEGAALRVVREDGEDLAVTADFDELRVNVAVEGGVITEVISLG